MEEQILLFFKTFVDVNRLRLAALLSENTAYTVEEIAVRLNLRLGEVTRHLNQLEKLGLLIREDRRFRLNVKALETLSRTALARPSAPVQSNDADADEFERAMVKNYSYPDGRLKEIPGQPKKRMAILKHVVQVFEPGERYTEKQVNEALSRYHDDFASLRRYLYDQRLIDRSPDGKAYWRLS